MITCTPLLYVLAIEFMLALLLAIGFFLALAIRAVRARRRARRPPVVLSTVGTEDTVWVRTVDIDRHPPRATRDDHPPTT